MLLKPITILLGTYLGLSLVCQSMSFPSGTYVLNQSHYREVTQGDIFMEQNMRFGLILGLKNGGADYEQLLRAAFSFFQGQKNLKIFLKLP